MQHSISFKQRKFNKTFVQGIMASVEKLKRKSSNCAGETKIKKAKVDKEKLPKRNKRGELKFADHPDFRPNRTPKEILQAGAFGGGYFRPIKSGVTNEKYKDCWKEFPEHWFEGVKPSLSIANSTYDKSRNFYKVKCGASLEEWESSGWIKAQDPYGWFQWYCRFYLGRRTEDDERQIGRWNRFLSRFKTNLVNKIKKADASYDNYTISPVIRQSLLHWGYQIVPQDLGGKRKPSEEESEKNVPLK
uniref:Putative cnidarian restricted protein n=1 Tax=Clytia hemisphaerica TaxID=252671 RepID=A0A069DM45_9CNID